MQKFYAGIGARKTPPNVLSIMTQLAAKLEKDGWVLRSGGAAGADSAFEAGIENPANKRIYTVKNTLILPEAEQSVDRLHPYPHLMGLYVWHLMARNYYQIHGYENDGPKSRFVVCYTPDGCKTHEMRTQKTGGTGQAISIACEAGVPVFNLAVKEDLQRILNYVGTEGFALN